VPSRLSEFNIRKNRHDRRARIDDSAVITQGSGKVNSKAEILKLLYQAEWSYNGSVDMRDAQFKQFGDTAVLTYIYTRNRRAGEYTIRPHVRKTAVYQRQASRWQLIASTAVALPNAEREQRPVDSKILDSYAGLYDGNVRITRDGIASWHSPLTTRKRLNCWQFQTKRSRIRGEGDSILFGFEKGPQGRFQLRAHNVGGSESVAKRLD
jgi:ketosteroid isomerase-like protein